jgi:hypothetical protein
MRVVEYTALTRMDGFAALDAAPLSGPGIGGFRFVRARRAERTGLRALVLERIRERIAGGRLRVTGSLAVLFVGSLTLAVIACGPRPAPPLAKARDAHALSRFAYTRATPAGGSQAGDTVKLPELAAVIEPAHAAGTSPISTSALPPARDASARFALPTKIEPLADTRPSLVRLAAAGGADEFIPLLPMVEVVTPEAPEADPMLPPEPTVKNKREIRRDRATRHKHSTPRARRAKSGVTPSGAAPKKIVRAPRWAQQMFDTPWQSTAFSYIR